MGQFIIGRKGALWSLLWLSWLIIEIISRNLESALMSHQQWESLVPRHAQSMPLPLFLPGLQRIDSPQLLSHLSHTRPQDYPSASFINQEINLENLLSSSHGPSIKRVSDNREKYREIKQKILHCMSTLKNHNSLSLSEVVQWKQTILSTFLNQVLVQIAKECKEKSQILVYIWNTAFNIIDYLFETVTRMGEREEKKYLESILSNHTSYQSVIQNIQNKLAKKEEERKHQEEFIKVLVYNLRYKRKEIKKLAKNLKLCTVKLNEFKDFYLDLQLEHIELLSQNRDISKENALNLLKRKQEINHQKRKEYKLKQSHKRIRFQIQNEIQNENKNEGQNVDKLNQQLQTAFNKYYCEDKQTKSMQNLEKAAQNIFQNALDDFNVRIDDIPQTETIIDFKNNIAFMDAATDMADFQGDTDEKQVQITFNDRLMEDMILHAAVQTVEFKPKAKTYEENGVQANDVDLKSMKLNRVKVIDRSYLLEDYREKDRRLKIQRNPTLKTKTEQYLKSMREIHYYDNNKKTVQLLDYQLQLDDGQNSVQVQTEDACIITFAHLPPKFRNAQFQREVHRYLDRAKRLSINIQNQQGDDTMGRTTPHKIKNMLRKGLRKNHQSDTFQENSQDFRNKSLPGSFYTTDRSKQSTVRISSRSRPLRERTSRGDTATIRRKPKDSGYHIGEIKESHYEEMGSKSQREGSSMAGAKFWVGGRKDSEQLSQDKRRFLNDLNLSDKLLNRFNSRFQMSSQNKKLLIQLQKMSEQLNSNKNLLEVLESNITQNMHILKQQLRKMLNKKRNNRRLPISRQKSLTKIISMVYTYAYHLYFNHQKPLVSLIIPLFHYFKIGYGEIKKNDLYLRMLYFLSQTVCHQEEYYIFQTFILFLGLNLDDNKLKIGRENTCLFLRLLSALSINFKFPLNVEHLYTTLGQLDSKCRQILVEQRYEPTIIEKVVQRVKVKLQSLISDGENYPAVDAAQYGEIKVNVFKCCQFIIEQLQKIKGIVYESYTTIYQYFLTVQGLGRGAFHTYIIRNLSASTAQKRTKLAVLSSALSLSEEMQGMSNDTYLYKVISVFLQLSIVDFNKMYFMALAKFRIKEEFLYLSINRRYQFLLKYLETHPQDFSVERALMGHLSLAREEKNINKEMVNKKVMGLAYLQVVENETHHLLQDVLGSNLWTLYGAQF